MAKSSDKSSGSSKGTTKSTSRTSSGKDKSPETKYPLGQTYRPRK